MATPTKTVADDAAEMHLLGSFAALAAQLTRPSGKVDGALWDDFMDAREEMIERGLLVRVPLPPRKRK